MNNEKMKHHIKALKDKHQKLDKQIQLLEAAGHITPMIEADISYLKKEKLRIKDELEQCERKLV